MVWACVCPVMMQHVALCAGGLLNELRDGQVEGAVMMRGPSTFGLPPKEAPGSILRRQVQQDDHSTIICCMAKMSKTIVYGVRPACREAVS